MQFRFCTGAVALGVAVACSTAGGVAQAQAPTSESSASQGLRKAVTVQGMQQHLQAFQGHSDFNGGTRAAGSAGFNASKDYVADQAEAAGLDVRFDDFQFLYNADNTPPVLEQVSPDAEEYVDGVDFASMTFSASVPETTAKVWGVDLELPASSGEGTSDSGCEASDFDGMPRGAIALTQRGTCSFALKARNAAAAGAAAAIVMNDGSTAGRTGVINGTLGGTGNGAALGASQALGVDLANGVPNGDTGSTATVRIDRVEETRTTQNVIAETRGGDADDVVVVGAHLDSVPRGAGINDNGSGSAGILEIAEQLARREDGTRNTVRFMWYSAEEFGLLGSKAYVDALPQSERDKIKAMLNFDMIGSPNYVRFVYDGDNSAFAVGPNAAEGPEGSGEIERIFHDFFRSEGLASDETPFSGRSDYGPFIAAGVDIPAGGLFTGAEGVKTAAQAAIYGGEAGQPYDECYHLRCDDLDNVDRTALDQMADAAAHATLTLGRRDFAKHPLVNPSAPVTGTGGTNDAGGGLHPPDDHHDEVER